MIEMPIGKLERNNHLNHLTKVTPFIVIVFGLQCAVLHFLTNMESSNASNMAPLSFGEVSSYITIIGIGIITMICSLMYYDYNHHIILYKKHLHLYFAVMGVNEEICYADIEDISVSDSESSFSTVKLHIKDGREIKLHFIDYPSHVREYILSLKAPKNNTKTDEDQDSFDDSTPKAA